MAIKRPAKKAAKKKVLKSTTGKKKIIAKAVKKAPASKKSAAKKKVTKKAASTGGGGVAGQNLPREYGEYGFVVGSNSEKIAEILVEGGFDRNEVNTKIFNALKKLTSVDEATLKRNIPSMVSATLTRLLPLGYTIESNWQLVPGEAPKKSKKKAAPAAKKAPAKKVPAKKVPAKKVAKKKAPAKRK